MLVCVLTPLATMDLGGQEADTLRNDLPRRMAPAAAAAISERFPNLIDAPVSRADYRLGPGDSIELSVFGERTMVHQLVVTPEGTLVIPSVGVVSILGLNLDEAELRAREAVLRYFRNVDVNLTLSRIRQFKVFVVGDVADPGVQVASAATRVSEVVAPMLQPDRPVLPRSVLLRRASGDTVRVDLVRFHQLGDFAANPLLREGDALIVPVTDRLVRVYGRVAFPGAYEFRQGETLAELLTLANAGAGFLADAGDTIRISRAGAAGAERVITLTQAEIEGGAGRAFVLNPFDAIYLPHVSDYLEQPSATVEGQVRFPGTYPIEPNTTTVRDLIRMAGGFREDASLATASLRRPKHGMVDRALRQLQEMPADLLSSSERRVLQAGSQGDETRVVIDFHGLFLQGQDAYDQAVVRNDTLHVPRHRNDVAIVGAVLRPGVVQHVPGYAVRDFVGLAGGYGRKADRGEMVVIKASTGSRMAAADVRSVEPGDMIIVPYRERRDYLQILHTTSSVVTTLTGLILTFLAFGR